MKNIPISVVALISGFSVLPAWGSGKDALVTLEKAVADRPQDRVVQMVGVRGQDQPPEWRVVVQDTESGNGVFYMYTVQGKSVVKRETVQKDYREQLPVATIPKGDILFDSKDAFKIADRQAKKAKIGFDSLNYELRCPELSRTPVWYVDLRDDRDRMVGRLFISAKNGEVLRQVWFPPNNAAPDKQQMVREEPPSSRHKGYLSQQAPQELPALSPLPTKSQEKKSPLSAIKKGMAKIPNPLSKD